MGYRFVPQRNHAQESQIFSGFFFPVAFAGLKFFEIQKVFYHGKVT